ncbi:hypothetical protein NL676_028523 [Syzygium grande]|nr:hypothetical protein NL676_028523 [Syzygium grande]
MREEEERRIISRKQKCQERGGRAQGVEDGDDVRVGGGRGERDEDGCTHPSGPGRHSGGHAPGEGPDATGHGGPIFGAAAAGKTKDEESKDKRKLDLGVTGTG